MGRMVSWTSSRLRCWGAWLRPLGEAAQVLVAEEAVRESRLRRREDDLSGVLADEREHALDQAQGADAALLVGGLGPLLERRPDPLAAREQVREEGALSWRWALASHPATGVLARPDAGVHRDRGLAVEDPHQVPIEADLHILAHEVRRRRIEAAAPPRRAHPGAPCACRAGRRGRARRRGAAGPSCRSPRSGRRPGGGWCRGSAPARWCGSSARGKRSALRGSRSAGP